MTEFLFVPGCPPSPPDDRDFAPQALSPEEIAKLPKAFVASHLPAVLNQGPEGTCAGHAAKSWAEHHEIRLGLGRLRSARDIYEGARIISPVAGEGAYLRAVCKRLAKEGACEERFWPYEADKKGAPKPGAEESRRTCKALEYVHIRGGDLAAIKAALVEHGPLLARIEVDDGFRSPRAGSPITHRGAQGGGHAVLIVGYDDHKGAWLLQNSWGTTWADAGRGWLAYTYGIGEAWSLKPAIVQKVAPPAPAPPPAPPTPTPPPLPMPDFSAWWAVAARTLMPWWFK